MGMNPSKRKLVEDGSPLLVYPSLAKKLGLNEAIILSQVHYWLQRSTNYRNGYYWTYHKYREWQNEFPFWGRNTIIRTIKKLKDDGYLITDRFNKAGYDKTVWYRIDYSKLDALQLDTTQNGQGSYPEWVGNGTQNGQTNTRDYTETTHNSQEPSSLRSHQAEETTIKSIIDYLNKQSGHSYHVTDKTKELIETRFSEGFTEQEFMDVIKYKSREWKDVTEMNPFLQPSTLFGDKMDKYLNQAKSNGGSVEPRGLSVEEGSAANDAYMAGLEKQYEAGKESP
ncbi:conserved phage C-terminal domain-containing protein [Levilactobacillus yiduensis]|uniref:conserved phage C-terminal domain-containing protein n=1 Tax=Levilactobacillus yiduensis TaxID=2953880 RepID=UPI002158851D|nr:conserved phage C-terminal domain-containing protein [Levilactobacillus yiduensis]